MADSSGKICLGFNMGNPDHEQVKKILDSLPKGAKSNFIVAAVLEYWVRHDSVIDARDYRKHGTAVKRLIVGHPDDEKLPEKTPATPSLSVQQARVADVANLEASYSVSISSDDRNDKSGEDDELGKIFMQGLNSFK